MVGSEAFQFAWIFSVCEKKPNQGETLQVYKLIDWFGPEQTDYRYKNALRFQNQREP